MNPKKTKIILYTWIAIFVAMTSFFVVVYLKVEKIKVETGVLYQQIAVDRESIEDFNLLKKTAVNIKEDSEKINTFFVKQDDVVGFLDKIESLGMTTGTQVLIQSVTDKKIATSTTLISIGVNAQGSYSNVHYFIRMLEELPYQTEIQNVNLSSKIITDEKKQSISSWSADVNIIGVMY